MTTKNATRKQYLTFQHIEDGYERDEWLGFGYLGGRRNAREAITSGEWEGSLSDIDDADELVLAIANAKHMTPRQFFTWLNSKPGRLVADELFGNAHPNMDMLQKYVG